MRARHHVQPQSSEVSSVLPCNRPYNVSKSMSYNQLEDIGFSFFSSSRAVKGRERKEKAAHKNTIISERSERMNVKGGERELRRKTK